MFLALQILATAAIFLFVRFLISSASLALACSFCIIISTNLNIIIGSPDPYFAYNPIRILFPALSLLALRWAQDDWSINRAFILGLFSGCSLAWNLDSGVAVLGAFGCFCITRIFVQRINIPRLFFKEVVAKLSILLLGTASSCCVFLTYLLLKSGFSVHLSGYFTYQRLFYIAGFAMIPIPPFPSWWTIPAFIVGLVLLIVCVRLASPLKGGERGIEQIGYLAALMVGLGVYFTGRSHWLVLRLAVWPAIILFFFLANQALQRSGSWTSRWANALVTSVLLGLPPCLVIKHQSDILSVYETLWTPQANSIGVAEDLRFIEALTKPNEAIGIMGDNQGTLYGESRTRPAIPGPSLAEMLRIRDLRAEQNSILQNGPEKLFYGQETMTGLGFDINAIRDVYALVSWSPSGRFMYLHRKPYSGQNLFDLDDPKVTWSVPAPTFSYVVNQQGTGHWGKPAPDKTTFDIASATISQSFAFRFIVQPDQNQPPFAALVSSHTGDFRGFAVLHQPDVDDGYFVVIGDGSKFWFSPSFDIPHGVLSEVIASYRDGHLIIKVSGQIVINQTGLGPISPAPVPITIGNWQGGDRQFSGLFREVEFFGSALAGT